MFNKATSVMSGEADLDGAPAQPFDVVSVGDSRGGFAVDGGLGTDAEERTSLVHPPGSSSTDNELLCHPGQAALFVIFTTCLGVVAGGTIDQPAAGAACGAVLGLLFLCCLCARNARNTLTPAHRQNLTGNASNTPTPSPTGDSAAVATSAAQAFSSHPAPVPPQDSGYEHC